MEIKLDKDCDYCQFRINNYDSTFSCILFNEDFIKERLEECTKNLIVKITKE